MEVHGDVSARHRRQRGELVGDADGVDDPVGGQPPPDVLRGGEDEAGARERATQGAQGGDTRERVTEAESAQHEDVTLSERVGVHPAGRRAGSQT